MLVFRFQSSFCPALAEYVASYRNLVDTPATAVAAAANWPRFTRARPLTMAASCRTRELSGSAWFVSAEFLVSIASYYDETYLIGYQHTLVWSDYAYSTEPSVS